MPDGIFNKIKNLASGGFQFAKDNLPAIAATAFFGPAAGAVTGAVMSSKRKADNIKNAASKIGQEAGREAVSEVVSEVASERFGKAVAKRGMNVTHKKLVPAFHKTLTKKPVVPVHEATHKKMTATKKVVKKKPVPATMDDLLNKRQNTRPDYH